MKPFTIDAAPQRSPEWYAARLGKLTGSRAADMLRTNKDGKYAASRRNLLTQLMLERITRQSQERAFVSEAMQDGIDREVDACALYEALTGRMLTQTGFLQHLELMAGCSLDGHVNDFEGIVEIKSPIPATHLEYLETGKIPADYQKQVVHNLWISGAQWCDWLSYCPSFSGDVEPLQVRLVRVMRNETDIAAYELMVRAFLKEVDAKVDAVRAMLPAETAVA